MTIKKTLLTFATVGTVAIGGTGIASAAEDTEADTSTELSSDLSSESDTDGSAVLGSVEDATADGALDPEGSVDADGFFNQFWSDEGDGVISLEGAAAILAGAAGVGASVYGISNAYTAAVEASDAWQGVVDDTTGFVQSQLPQ